MPALPDTTTIPISRDVSGDEEKMPKRPVTIVGATGGGSLNIWLGPKTGKDMGRIYIETTPTGYTVLVYRNNDVGDNAAVEINTAEGKMEVMVDEKPAVICNNSAVFNIKVRS